MQLSLNIVLLRLTPNFPQPILRKMHAKARAMFEFHRAGHSVPVPDEDLQLFNGRSQTVGTIPERQEPMKNQFPLNRASTLVEDPWLGSWLNVSSSPSGSNDHSQQTKALSPESLQMTWGDQSNNVPIFSTPEQQQQQHWPTFMASPADASHFQTDAMYSETNADSSTSDAFGTDVNIGAGFGVGAVPNDLTAGFGGEAAMGIFNFGGGIDWDVLLSGGKLT